MELNAATTIPGWSSLVINGVLLHAEVCQSATRANSLSGTGGHGSPEVEMRGFHPQLTGPKDIGKHSKFSHPVHIRGSLKTRSGIFVT